MLLPVSFLKGKSQSSKHPLVVRVVAGIVRRWKLLLGIIAVIFGITQTAGFTSFIIEEKQQQLGFGVFSYLQAKQWEPARDSLLWCIEDAKRDRKAYRILNLLNPLTGWSFVDYGEANIRKLKWQLDSVERRLGIVEKKVEQIAASNVKPIQEVSIQESAIKPVRQIEEKAKPEGPEFVATMFGKKYHRPGCRFVQGKQVRALTKEEAQAEGL